MKWLRTLALTGVLVGGTVLAVVLTERAGWPRQVVIPVELALMVVLCEVIDGRLRSRREILAGWTRRRLAQGPCDVPCGREIRRGLRAARGCGGAWAPDLDVAVRRLCHWATRSGDARLVGDVEALLDMPQPVVQLAAAEALVRIGGYPSVGKLRTVALGPVDAVLAGQLREAADRLHERLAREGVELPSYASI